MQIIQVYRHWVEGSWRYFEGSIHIRFIDSFQSIDDCLSIDKLGLNIIHSFDSTELEDAFDGKDRSDKEINNNSNFHDWLKYKIAMQLIDSVIIIKFKWNQKKKFQKKEKTQSSSFPLQRKLKSWTKF